jgi:hypothetical protein
VEKDGSLTDIKVLRDIGYGTGKEAKSVNQVRDGIQVFKMGSRLEYYILFRSKFKQRINVGKGINYSEEIAQRAISSSWHFVFVVYLVLGLLIIFMKDFP